jgi:hypothetical protein
MNTPGSSCIAYCWAESPTQSFGEYTGNNGTQTIECGFAPAYVMIKNTSASGDWAIVDNARGSDVSLYADLSNAEANTSFLVFTDSGFTLGSTSNNVNAGENQYIYAAFADTSDGTKLTFEEPNEDLKYFQPGDQVGAQSGFTPVVYTGNGGTQSITGLGFSPDLVWMKARNQAYWHTIYDTVRGPTNELSSNVSNGESIRPEGLIAFNADGFTLGGYVDTNNDAVDFVAWCFDAGDTTVTNNDGTLESQVRSNGNFSVITVTGFTGESDSMNFGHGLSSVPGFILAKNTDTDSDWVVYSTDLGQAKKMPLNSGGAADNVDGDDNYFNQVPTSSTISFRANSSNTTNWVFYAWAEAPGASFGEYTGTGSAGIDVSCGFEPAFVLVKDTTSANNWIIWDNARNPSNPRNNYLNPDTNNAETVADSSLAIDFTPTGFTVNGTSTAINTTNNKYIYAAFAGPTPVEVVDVDVANNTMTVDGGDWHGTNDWNQSQVWSNNLTTPGGFDDPTSKIFNNSGGMLSTTNNAAIATLEFSPLITDVTSIFVDSGQSSSYNFDITYTIDGTTSSSNSNGTVLVDSLSGILSKITIKGTAGSGRTYLKQIKINGEVLIDPFIPPTGETQVTGPPLIATANDVEYLDGNTLGVSGVSGSWRAGLNAQGAEVTASAPSPESIQYTSANGDPLTTPFTGTDATLTTRTWTWQVSNAVTGPWSDFAIRTDLPGQDGAVPLADRPTLEPNKFYQVKVRYDSNNAEYVESTFNTFKTGDN